MSTAVQKCRSCRSEVHLKEGEIKVSESKRTETVDPDGGYPFESERTYRTVEFTCPCGCKNKDESHIRGF